MIKTKEPWIVDVTYDMRKRDVARTLKSLIRKPVSFSSVSGPCMSAIAWTYATKRGARRAADRLRQHGFQHVDVIDGRPSGA
jgi:hypothetical protein